MNRPPFSSGGSSRASQHSAAVVSSSARSPVPATGRPPFTIFPAEASYPTPVTSMSCPSIQTLLTVISFCVSVPVLSVQMAVAHPSVSTEESRLISAFRFAMRCTAIASDSVTVGSSPSGMNATIMPSAKINAATGEFFARKMASTKKTAPMLTEMMETFLVRSPISSCRGLGLSFTFWVRLAILPNSVCEPVPQTTALPVPEEMVVPANTMLGISTWVRSPRRTASLFLRTGFDSPVSVDWFTRRSLSTTRRASAEMRSPSESRITSPGTRSSATSFCS